jgi:hypothetical protein
MSFREILQFELWSKQTSRKLMKVFGAGFTIFVLLVFCLYLFDTKWISSEERRTAKVALALVDSLQQQYLEGDEKDYEAKAQRAKDAVNAAVHAAMTSRDDQIANALFAYVTEIDVARGNRKTDRMMQERHIVFKYSDPESNAKLAALETELAHSVSLGLHQALGN